LQRQEATYVFVSQLRSLYRGRDGRSAARVPVSFAQRPFATAPAEAWKRHISRLLIKGANHLNIRDEQIASRCRSRAQKSQGL